MREVVFRNKAKEKMLRGELTIGTGMGWPDPTLVESFARAGLDFFRIEGEHGPSSYIDLAHLVTMALLYDITPMARVPGCVQHEILHYLDAGVMGITIPHTCNRDVAEKAVFFARHVPLGNRGDAYPMRARHYGAGLSQDEYYRRVNEATLVIALIEDIEGVENIERILSVPGIDAVDIGPYDLRQSMGLAPSKEVDEAVERVVSACVKAGKPVQVGGSGNYRKPEIMKHWIERGVRTFLVGGFFEHGVSECMKVVDGFRKSAGEKA